MITKICARCHQEYTEGGKKYCANCAPDAHREYAKQRRLTHPIQLEKKTQIETFSISDLALQAPRPYADNVAIERAQRQYRSEVSRKHRNIEVPDDETQLRKQERQYCCLSSIGFKTARERRYGWEKNAGGLDRDAFIAKCEMLEWHCQLCGKVLTKETVTIDHIVPLAKHGKNNIDNLQPLCRSCNSHKGVRSIKNLPELSLEAQIRMAKSLFDSDDAK